MKKISCLIVLVIFLGSVSKAQYWQLNGNTPIPGTDFLGSTGSQQLDFRTNGITRFKIGTNAALTPYKGAFSIGSLDPDLAPYGGTLLIQDPNLNSTTAISLVRSPGTPSGWNNQIRFYNYNNMRHVISDEYPSGKLVIQTRVDPASDAADLVDIRGRLQIGTGVALTPAGYSLYCENGILAERVKVALKTTSDWSDYVFHKSYKLLSLDSLEKYVAVNFHLPGIPTAEAMVQQGNDLGKTDASLLAKIEELTLYVIELNKQKKNMEAQVQSLTEKLDNQKGIDIEQIMQQLIALKKEVEQLKK
jgi:hypothetical protein